MVDRKLDELAVDFNDVSATEELQVDHEAEPPDARIGGWPAVTIAPLAPVMRGRLLRGGSRAPGSSRARECRTRGSVVQSWN